MTIETEVLDDAIRCSKLERKKEYWEMSPKLGARTDTEYPVDKEWFKKMVQHLASKQE